MCANTIPASNHNNPLRGSSVADSNYKRFKCNHCAKEFEAKKEKRYCSRVCNVTYNKKHKITIPRAEYVAKMRENAVGNFVCEYCGKDSYRGMSGTNPGPSRFCSMACRTAKTVAAGDLADMARQEYRRNVLPEIEALRRIARYVEKPLIFRCNCLHCDAAMIVRRNGGLHKKVCDTCAAALLKTLRAISKAKRRAVERGVEAHSINPIAVFERDKWKCRLCGVSTPRALRGTYEPRAPELDHILPLSKGGSHTWGNVQCACRACNGAKSNKPLGQFSFDMAC